MGYLHIFTISTGDRRISEPSTVWLDVLRPPFGCLVPWRTHDLKIGDSMLWLTKSKWQVTFWRGASSTRRRSFSLQVQRRARQVPFSVPLSLQSQCSQVEFMKLWHFPPDDMSLQEPIVKAKWWCGEIFVCWMFSVLYSRTSLDLMVCWLVLGSSKTEDSIHVESPCFQRIRGTRFKPKPFFWQLKVEKVLQLHYCH